MTRIFGFETAEGEVISRERSNEQGVVIDSSVEIGFHEVQHAVVSEGTPFDIDDDFGDTVGVFLKRRHVRDLQEAEYLRTRSRECQRT